MGGLAGIGKVYDSRHENHRGQRHSFSSNRRLLLYLKAFVQDQKASCFVAQAIAANKVDGTTASSESYVCHRTDEANDCAYIELMLNINPTHDELRVKPSPTMAAPYGLPSSNANGGARHACPMCKRPVIRIWRRPIDRITSQFVPVHRFHCEGFSCGWEGNFRIDAADPGKKTSVLQRATTASMLVLVLVTSVALVVTLAIAVVGWISSYDQLREQIGLYSQPHARVIQASADLNSLKGTRPPGSPDLAGT